MSIFSISGLSSGIDFQNITSKLIEFEKRPIDLMEAKQEEFKSQLNVWNQIRNKLSELESAANAIKSLSDLNPVTGSFSNNNTTDNSQVVSIASTGVTNEQNFDITVEKVARNHRIMSNGVSSIPGTLNQGTFAVTVSGTTTDFTISNETGENDTLTELKSSINGANIGVTASIVNDGSDSYSQRLVLTSDDPGADNSISTSHTAEELLIFGTYIVPHTVLDDFTELQAAQDAEINFGGQTITRTTNTIEDLIEDTTLKIHNVGSGTITFDNDSATLKDRIATFIDKYNEARLFIEEQINYNQETKQRGKLFGDSTLLSAISNFNTITGDEVTGFTGDYTSLASIGITTSKDDGTLTTDEAMLDEAIANDFESVTKIFASSGTTSTSYLEYVDSGRDTASGTYTVYYTGTDSYGNVEGYFEDSDGNVSSAYGTGRYLFASSGEGYELTVKIDDAASTGAVGTVTYATGVAQRLSTELYNLNTFDGRLYDKTTNLEDIILENAKKIQLKMEMLDKKEMEYKRRFAALEGIIGSMQGQSEFLSSQLSSLPKSYLR